jgi:UDP-N-acetyl-D-galactosamine dehydrogenase
MLHTHAPLAKENLRQDQTPAGKSVIAPSPSQHPSAERIAVIGLGYVGLPLGVSLARAYDDVLGFDVSLSRVDSLQDGIDHTGEIEAETLRDSSLIVSANPGALLEANFYIVTVPTPIDDSKQPDLNPLKNACGIIGRYLCPGDIVVFESTVYPGVTEDVCAPILESMSGLTVGTDFNVGYSPERINPGDKQRPLESIVKVVSADTDEALDRVAAVYSSVITAGIHRCASIKVAEAAKVVENTQRDVNIALMNELALIFDRLDIDTTSVVEAAATKWNFQPFKPGLVGGHCIGVDPYYLSSLSETLGQNPQLIMAARRVNESIASHVVGSTIKKLCQRGVNMQTARIGLFGVTFKEDVPDVRNSKSFDIIEELQSYGVDLLVHDPFIAAGDDVAPGVKAGSLGDMTELDAMIVAVGHKSYLDDADFLGRLVDDGCLIDIKSAFNSDAISENQVYWSL